MMGKKKRKTASEEDAANEAIYNDGLTRVQRRAEWEEQQWWRILNTMKQTKCRTEAWKIAKFDIARLTFDPRAADLKPPPRSSYICYDRKCCDGEKNKVDKITERPPEPEASPPKKSPTPPPKARPKKKAPPEPEASPPKKSLSPEPKVDVREVKVERPSPESKKSKAKEKEKSKVKEERSMRPSVEESREGRSRKSTVKLQARSRPSRSRTSKKVKESLEGRSRESNKRRHRSRAPSPERRSKPEFPKEKRVFNSKLKCFRGCDIRIGCTCVR